MVPAVLGMGAASTSRQQHGRKRRRGERARCTRSLISARASLPFDVQPTTTSSAPPLGVQHAGRQGGLRERRHQPKRA